MDKQHRDGPSLDQLARQRIEQEEQRHRSALQQIEAEPSDRRPDLYSQEDQRHLRELSQIYTELAERQIDGPASTGPTLTP